MSQSILWQLQQAAYCKFGPQAWSHKGVPFYVTSNPFTVRQYAQVVLGYFRDCLSPNAATPIDTSEPIYILDLGAGTGRFGYLFIYTLLELLKSKELEKIKFCYIMTDIAEKNIAFWQQHSYLQPLVEEGVLDFAFYNSAQIEPIHLIHSKKTLSKEKLHNPLLLIANYFFDTIPQDLFCIKNGSLKEGLISISVDATKELGELVPSNPNIVPHMQCKYDYVPIDNLEYYPNPIQNTILKNTIQKYPEATFLFPTGAFLSLKYFTELSQNRLFLLAGDQGVCTDSQIANWGEPVISRHGTFSIAVNYDAIAQFFTVQNGSALTTSFPNSQFIVITGVLGGTKTQFPETELAFRSNLDYFEPCDYWRLVNYVEEGWKNPPLEYILLLLKWGNWDPMVFNDYYNIILQALPQASKELKNQFIEVISRVWKHFYPVSTEEGAFAMNLGVLLYHIGEPKEALIYYNQALKLMGKTPQLLQNIMACYQQQSMKKE